MIALLDPASIIEQLKTNAPIYCNRVYDAVEGDDEVEIVRVPTPLALVYVREEVATIKDKSQKTARQKVSAIIAITTIIRVQPSKDDYFNSAETQILKSARNEMFTALLGFPPPNCTSILYRNNSELIKKDKDSIRWRDTFEVSYLIKSTQ